MMPLVGAVLNIEDFGAVAWNEKDNKFRDIVSAKLNSRLLRLRQ